MKAVKIYTDPKKGRGVYADENIKKGETIEICHIIVIDFDEIGDTLEGYVYEFSRNEAALALGNGSLYNHNNRPNAEFSINKKQKMITIKALKAINSGEEITIHYNYSKADREKFNIS